PISQFPQNERGRMRPAPSNHELRSTDYLRCLFTSLVISNMLTTLLPPKTGLRAASAWMLRRFLASWSLFFLMYAQSFLVTSVRGIGLAPTTPATAALRVTRLLNPA